MSVCTISSSDVSPEDGLFSLKKTIYVGHHFQAPLTGPIECLRSQIAPNNSRLRSYQGGDVWTHNWSGMHWASKTASLGFSRLLDYIESGLKASLLRSDCK